MRILLLFAILSLTNVTLFGQELDSLQKARMDEMQREMIMRQQHLQPKEVDNFSNYFKPELIDSFFIYIQQEQYHKLYHNTDDLLKKMQSEDDLMSYFKALKRIYGKLKSYEHESYTIKNQMMSMNKVASAIYSVEFEKANAKVATAFNIIDSISIKLQAFQIVTEEYTVITEFDSVSRSTFTYLTSKDYPGLYNSTSKRFQDYTPIVKFDEFMNNLDTVDFKSHKLFKNQISVVQGKSSYYLIYDINNGKGYLSLTYIETDGKFLLEGLNYKATQSK